MAWRLGGNLKADENPLIRSSIHDPSDMSKSLRDKSPMAPLDPLIYESRLVAPFSPLTDDKSPMAPLDPLIYANRHVAAFDPLIDETSPMTKSDPFDRRNSPLWHNSHRLNPFIETSHLVTIRSI
jgi:hypothetical protein